ncbi:hypothetical protein IWQ57_003089 [Coemansia nantahalensis]|uniref:Uncharacterized protein n=1 Tax=Coemansia nantahalensis TaxID=2789366 RepID=A0ACC1JXX6_9FUNG|nr:hypothetical protein IWQ57_003089 [Coemansia nantahalensis]
MHAVMEKGPDRLAGQAAPCDASEAPEAPLLKDSGFSDDAALYSSPLRAPLLWRNTRARSKCIVYLEPRVGSPLYRAVEGFFRVSAEQLGYTEAHQYHPHSSMTGFIDLADLAAAGSGVVARIVTHLQRAIAANGRLPMPRARKVRTTSDYPHAGTHKIEIQLDTPPVFRAIAEEVAAMVPDAGIRPKRMAHISLAYSNKHVDTGTTISADRARALDALAATFLVDPAIEDPAQNLWDIAFYELSFKSPVVSTPHRFTQIARWPL